MATPLVLGDVQWDAFLKELYPEGVPQDLLTRKHPFLSMVQKDGNTTGEYMVIPVMYDQPTGRSATISTLLNTTSSQPTSTTSPISPTKSAKFTPSLVEDYAATWLNMLTVYKTMNDRGAFVEARKREIDGILTQLGNSLSHAAYRDGTGAVGRGASGITAASATVTLSAKSDTRYFYIGGLYHVANGATGVAGALRDGGDVVEVLSIDEDAGTVTFTTVVSTTITGAVDNDFFITAGDLNEKITGLAGWIPLAAPSATTFFGVDRTVYPSRLAGSRLDQSTVPAEDTILDLADIMAERGSNPDRCFVSPRQFTKMCKRLNAKVEYEGAGGDAGFGFSSVTIHTAAGPVRVTPDPDCPENRGYLLTMDTWHMKHLLELPHIVADDNIRALRRPALDQIEIRARYYAQLVCYAPIGNGVFSCS